jgi:hypothetical protein
MGNEHQFAQTAANSLRQQWAMSQAANSEQQWAMSHACAPYADHCAQPALKKTSKQQKMPTSTLCIPLCTACNKQPANPSKQAATSRSCLMQTSSHTGCEK